MCEGQQTFFRRCDSTTWYRSGEVVSTFFPALCYIDRSCHHNGHRLLDMVTGKSRDGRLLIRLKAIFLATLSFTFIVSAIVQLQAFDREAAWDLATSVPLTASYYDRYVPVDDAKKLAKYLDMATARLTDPRPRRDFTNLTSDPPLHLSQLKKDGRVFATMYCSRSQDLDECVVPY